MTTLPARTDRALGLVIDLDTCVGCHACVVACKEWNTSAYGAPLADLDAYGPEPEGTFLNRIHTFEAVPETGAAAIEATGGAFDDVERRTTKSVTDWGGRETEIAPVAVPTSATRVMAFDEVSCQRSAVPEGTKFASVIVAGVEPESALLITITVSAPSAVRSAAKAETVSGVGAVARTLTSPKVDRAPS